MAGIGFLFDFSALEGYDCSSDNPMQGWESEWGGGGGGQLGPKKNKKKQKKTKKTAIFSNNYDLGKLSKFPENQKKTVIFLKINWLYS